MNFPETKQKIISAINNIDDEKTLTAIQEIINLNTSFEKKFPKLSVADLIERALESEDAIGKGHVSSLADVRSESENW